MNLQEGTRRLALFLGVGGFLFGGFVSYFELKSLLEQNERHKTFERFATSDIVQQERKSLQNQSRNVIQIDPKTGERVPAEHGPWEKYAPQSQGEKAPDYAIWGTDIHKGGIKTVWWNIDYSINSIQTEDGQDLQPTSTPSKWMFAFVMFCPFIAFLIPWGIIRAIGWVCTGFFQPAS